MTDKEKKGHPTKCPHGVAHGFLCNDCMNPYHEDQKKNEELRAKFRATEPVGYRASLGFYE